MVDEDFFLGVIQTVGTLLFKPVVEGLGIPPENPNFFLSVALVLETEVPILEEDDDGGKVFCFYGFTIDML